ncbi:hypothetical protein AcV5_009558 [Taiwanofungus camphoratus]|nr:hypothetical protein AcV5_009558 [Antrodia cinnamomea]
MIAIQTKDDVARSHKRVQSSKQLMKFPEKVGKHLSIQGISLTFPSLKKKRTLRHQELEGPKTLWDLEVKRHFLRKTQEFLTPPAFAGFGKSRRRRRPQQVQDQGILPVIYI